MPLLTRNIRSWIATNIARWWRIWTRSENVGFPMHVKVIKFLFSFLIAFTLTLTCSFLQFIFYFSKHIWYVYSSANFIFTFTTGNIPVTTIKQAISIVLVQVLHCVHRLVVKLGQICFNDRYDQEGL